MQKKSEDALCHHGAGHLHEAGHVGTAHVVDSAVFALAILHTLGMDVFHDAVETLVDLLSAPREVLRILRHFQTRNRHTAGIGSLAWSIENACFEEGIDSFRR